MNLEEDYQKDIEDSQQADEENLDDENEIDDMDEVYEESEDPDELKEKEETEKIYDINSKNIPFEFRTNKKHNKNMYFDNAKVEDLIVNVYQPSLVYDENGKIISKNEKAEKEIMVNLFSIANAIINKYSYWRFDSVDELQAECLAAMWKYLPKFTPGKGTAFNLFSILCKRHLLNYTLKNQKHRLTADIDICTDVKNIDEEHYNLFFEDLENNFLKIIDSHFVKAKRKRYTELCAVLMEYLYNNRNIVGKNDLLSAFREYGFKSSDYRKFILDMKKYETSFYELAS